MPGRGIGPLFSRWLSQHYHVTTKYLSDKMIQAWYFLNQRPVVCTPSRLKLVLEFPRVGLYKEILCYNVGV